MYYFDCMYYAICMFVYFSGKINWKLEIGNNWSEERLDASEASQAWCCGERNESIQSSLAAVSNTLMLDYRAPVSRA